MMPRAHLPVATRIQKKGQLITSYFKKSYTHKRHRFQRDIELRCCKELEEDEGPISTTHFRVALTVHATLSECDDGSGTQGEEYSGSGEHWYWYGEDYWAGNGSVDDW